MIATRIPWYSCGDGHFGGKLRLPVPMDRADALPHRRIKEAGSARRLDRFFAADADAVHIIVPQRPKPTGLHRAARADALLLAHRRTRRGDGHRPFAEVMFVRFGWIVGIRVAGDRSDRRGPFHRDPCRRGPCRRDRRGSVSSGSSGPPGSPGCTMPPVSSPGGVLSQAEKAAQPNASRTDKSKAQKFFHTFPCLISISLTV